MGRKKWMNQKSGEIVNESSENQPRCMIILLLVSLLWHLCGGQ